MKLKWRYALSVFALLFVAALYVDAVLEPQRPHGYALFRSSYALSTNKSSMLQNYEANLRNHNGSYIPERVDNFLCSKLQTSQSTEEVTAIVDFYAFKAGGREGRVIYLLPAQTKKRIISLLLERLDNYDERKSHSALILVEVLRRGEYLYKAYFSPVRSASYNYENWWPKVGLPEAKMRFRRWWNSSSSWQQKEMHDPLKDSNLQIVSP